MGDGPAGLGGGWVDPLGPEGGGAESGEGMCSFLMNGSRVWSCGGLGGSVLGDSHCFRRSGCMPEVSGAVAVDVGGAATGVDGG